jgi:hypothetical protein
MRFGSLPSPIRAAGPAIGAAGSNRSAAWRVRFSI